MHDNRNIEVRCRTLWSEILKALDTRIHSVNHYMPDKRSHIVCSEVSDEAIHLHHASSERSIIASLDLKKHAIHLKEYHDRELQHAVGRKDMPLSMLADGELYVTDGNELKADAMEVAKALLDILLAAKEKKHVAS
ncbi:MAG TPA: hypothetical protein VGL89_11685 [Candidatus Koribacter sp.]